ncbi:MAG: hypothetical protein Q8N76_03795 [Candidatus Omnitrophota bacterium]|nr:hypothetical protein [Candidatus Omnitrophota bacterium]
MLSAEEKKEMLEDSLSKARRDDFRFMAGSRQECIMDEFLTFLNSVQEVFGPFKPSNQPVVTKLNKL